MKESTKVREEQYQNGLTGLLLSNAAKLSQGLLKLWQSNGHNFNKEKEMISEFAQAVLKNHKINEEDVESVDNSLVVTFKDGSKQQICEVWSRVMG